MSVLFSFKFQPAFKISFTDAAFVPSTLVGTAWLVVGAAASFFVTGNVLAKPVMLLMPVKSESNP